MLDVTGYKCDECGAKSACVNKERDKQIDRWHRENGWLVSNRRVLCPYCKAKRPRYIQIKQGVAHAQSKGCYLFIQIGTTAIYLGNRKSNRQGLQIRICTPCNKFQISYDA